MLSSLKSSNNEMSTTPQTKLNLGSLQKNVQKLSYTRVDVFMNFEC